MKKVEWVAMWDEYMDGIEATLVRTYQQDIAAGYNPHSMVAAQERADIDTVSAYHATRMAELAVMNPAAAARWARADLRRRGAIE